MKTEKELQCCVTDCEVPLDQKYWEERYDKEEHGWDIGYASDPLVAYTAQLINKDLSILIPGAGNAYEIDVLLDQGFSHITVIDIAKQPIEALSKKYENEEKVQLIQGDFFDHQGKYDLILEQTFFCALPPSMREEYVKKMNELLKPDGKLVGVLFDKRFEKGPPFGGCPCEYKPLFQEYFDLIKMEECYNSIPPRQNDEVFFIYRKIES